MHICLFCSSNLHNVDCFAIFICCLLTTDWICYPGPSLYQAQSKSLGHQQEYSMLSNWYFLWCLPRTNHLSYFWCSLTKLKTNMASKILRTTTLINAWSRLYSSDKTLLTSICNVVNRSKSLKYACVPKWRKYASKVLCSTTYKLNGMDRYPMIINCYTHCPTFTLTAHFSKGGLSLFNYRS